MSNGPWVFSYSTACGLWVTVNLSFSQTAPRLYATSASLQVLLRVAVLDSEGRRQDEAHETSSEKQRPMVPDVLDTSGDGSSSSNGNGKGPDTAVAVVTADASVGGLGDGMRQRNRLPPLSEQPQAELPGVGASARSGLVPCGDCDACTAVTAAAKAVAVGHLKPD